ncbi:MAG TPA: S16 family serine protease [Nitrososphaera sp.]|nr:S16 family serine protease [Nitrososphaera sp.]
MSIGGGASSSNGSSRTTTVAILGVVVVGLIVANVFQYIRSGSLQQSIDELQSKNKELSDSLRNANSSNNSTTTTIGSPPIVTGTMPPTMPSSSSASSQQGSGNQTDIVGTSQSITAVAVKEVPVSDGFFQSIKYQGTTMDITVDIRDGGRGLVLVNTEVPTGVDFQTSAKTAVKVAQSITGADLSKKDIIFSISSKGNNNSGDLQAADGPSAGGAMTTLLISELQGKELKRDVVMTGTINPDGTIGPVGGVPEKAQAAGQYGAKLFLVPQGQAVYTQQTCQQKTQGPIVYQTCQSEQKPLSEYTEKNYNMKVVEVRDVKEALSYFQSK